MSQFKPNNIKSVVGDKSAGVTRVTPAALRKTSYELFGCHVVYANVNKLNLWTLPQERRFQLISFTFALLWNEPNSTPDATYNSFLDLVWI